ncbi:MAG: ribonuclease P protein component 1 [Candidatus Micrarchaeia archaeon]
MQYNNRNIVLSELIGLKVKLVKCSDKKQEGLEGIVSDETKNTLIINTKTGIKRIIKKTAVFKFYAGNKSFTVKGIEISFRPHERIEKAMKYYKKREV